MPYDGDLDKFIMEHSKSMTMREIAERTGVTKSTVSRHAAKLREEGKLNDDSLTAARAASESARRAVESADAGSRLSALRELRDMLREELNQSGGASMARVASEYRKTLEEIDAIDHEDELARNAGHEVTPLQLMIIRSRVFSLSGRGTADVDEVIINTLKTMVNMGLVTCSKTHILVANFSADNDVSQDCQ